MGRRVIHIGFAIDICKETTLYTVYVECTRIRLEWVEVRGEERRGETSGRCDTQSHVTNGQPPENTLYLNDAIKTVEVNA